VFARLYVAAYAGYSIPALSIGIIAVHTSFAVAFLSIIAVLAAIAAALPFLRERPATTSCPNAVCVAA
jgi:hypothetical protein